MHNGQGTVTQALNQIVLWFLTKFHPVRFSNLEHLKKIAMFNPASPFPHRKQEKIEFSEITKDVCSHILISIGRMWRRPVDQPRVRLGLWLDVWSCSLVCVCGPEDLFIYSLRMDVCVRVCAFVRLCVRLTRLWQDEMGQKVLVDRRIVFTPKALLKM